MSGYQKDKDEEISVQLSWKSALRELEERVYR